MTHFCVPTILKIIIIAAYDFIAAVCARVFFVNRAMGDLVMNSGSFLKIISAIWKWDFRKKSWSIKIFHLET